MSCLPDLTALVTHGANGVCGPPTISVAAIALFLIGVAGTLGLWSRRARSAIALCVLFAFPGWWALSQRHIDEEPVSRLRMDLERFADAHGHCLALVANECPVCDPIYRRARTPSRSCARPALVELRKDALSGPCIEEGDRLTCGPR